MDFIKKENVFKKGVHFIFISGFFYAFFFYITSPKATEMHNRRLWAYESWIIFTLYTVFLWLFSITRAEEDIDNKLAQKLYNKKFTSALLLTTMFASMLAIILLSR